MFALDFAFESMNTYGINKLKEMVDSKNEIVNEVVEENTQTQTTNEEVQTSENVSE